MAEQKNGSIINIASTCDIVALEQSNYGKEDCLYAFYKSASYPTAEGVIVFLAFEASQYLSGVNLIINGGLTDW